MDASTWILYVLCPCRKHRHQQQQQPHQRLKETARDGVSSSASSKTSTTTTTTTAAVAFQKTDSMEAPSPPSELPIMPQVARGVQQGVKAVPDGKGGLEPAVEEEEPLQDIEMPPPMEIQEHTFKTDTKEVSTDDVTAQLASQLSLKPQGDGTTSVDLANQIENIVKQRIDPSLELAGGPAQPGQPSGKPDTSTGLEQVTEDGVASGKEEEEDKADDGKDAETQKAEALRKRQFVIQELFDTEKDYVKDLATIVNGYMEYMKENPLPGETEGKDKIVFGNIHQIYDWHRETMMAELEKCLTNPGRVGSIFIRYERRLYMYVKYCENKPKSEYVVSENLDTYFEEVRQKLGHRLMLPDLLIKPVQRIMRYQLLLKDILKYTERAKEDSTDLKKALRVMCVVPKAANDMMQVGRLQGFDGKITAQGKLLLQDTLLVSEASSGSQQKPKERRVFLFEQIVIFSEIEGKKGTFSNATYVFKNSLKANKMSLTENVEGDPLKFMLTDRTPGSDARMIVQCKSEENKDTWIKQIRSILDMQGDFLRALQSPIAYQKELTKELSAPEFNSAAGGGGTGGGSAQDTALLRKTQSHPVRGHHLTPSKALAAKTRAAAEEQLGGARAKGDRCRSTPGPLSSIDPSGDGGGGEDGGGGGGGGDITGKASCPSSPQDTSGKDFMRGLGNSDSGSNLRKSSMTTAGAGDSLVAGSSSPKPKRTIFEGFRNTLGRKSKPSTTDTSSAAAAAAAAAANANMVNVANITISGGGDTPSPSSADSSARISSGIGNSNNNVELPLSPEDMAAAAASSPSPSQSATPLQGEVTTISSSLTATPASSRLGSTITTSTAATTSSNNTTTTSSSNNNGEAAMTSGRILFDYQAIKEDEVTVSKGELVQIISTNHQNMFLIHRPANSVSPAAEGWVPCHVIGPRDGDGSSSLRKGSKQMFKIKKPVFRSPQRADFDGRDQKDLGEAGDSGIMDRAREAGRDGKTKVKVKVTCGMDKAREVVRDGKTKVKWSSSELGLEVAPMVQQPLTSLTVQAGDTATLTCRVCGRPRPQVQWRYRDSQIIVQGHSPRVLMMYNEEGLATLQ
ncbi:kalirin-like isoform x11, partial [Plakobranchus ocellatus]